LLLQDRQLGVKFSLIGYFCFCISYLFVDLKETLFKLKANDEFLVLL